MKLLCVIAFATLCSSVFAAPNYLSCNSQNISMGEVRMKAYMGMRMENNALTHVYSTGAISLNADLSATPSNAGEAAFTATAADGCTHSIVIPENFMDLIEYKGKVVIACDDIDYHQTYALDCYAHEMH